MDMEIIFAAVFAAVLIIVIISALTKKKKLNHDERSEDRFAPREEESSRVAEQYHSTPIQAPSSPMDTDVYSTLLYYVFLDGNTYGPYSLTQLKTYPLLEDTLITTNTLNGTWYEAKYFECLDDLFRPNLPFRIDADGVIIRA